MARLSPGARGSMEFSDFCGVDFTSSPLHVSHKRAAKAENFVREHGMTRKRHGWAQQLKITEDGKGARINGIFEFVDGARREVIIHAGRRLYRMITSTDGRYSVQDITRSGTYAAAAVDVTLLKDTRSQGFLCGKKLYIVGIGDYLVYGSWDEGQTYELRRVYENEDTYVPKTTVNIGYVPSNNSTTNGDIRGSLDCVNYMTGWRRNGITGLPAGEQNATSAYYYPDTTIDEGTTVTVKTIMGGYTYRNDPSSQAPNALRMVMEDGTLSTKGYGNVDYEYSRIVFPAESKKVSGSSYYDQVYANFFTIPGMGEVGGEDVAEIIFYHHEEGYAERITNCEFGILFGTSGNTDRLFVSGNPDFPNVDFFSAADDYTYFEDMNTVTMGSDSYRTLGYARLSDNTLAIFKERSQSEASIFYRTGYYSEYYTDAGALDEILSVFPTTAGNIGETMLSRHACADFGGDNLILSENGVFGIELADNVATAVRYTRERSRSINGRLLQEPHLEDAAAIVYRDKYVLAVNGHLYIADARHKYRPGDALDYSYNYEWWYCTGVPARLLAQLDGDLWFGTEDGCLCRFDTEYADREYFDIAAGEMTIDEDQKCLYYSAALPFALQENDMLRIYGGAIYAVCVEKAAYRAATGRFYTDEQTILHLYDGQRVYLDHSEMGAVLGGAAYEYTVADVDVGDASFVLLWDGVAVNLDSDDVCRICTKHDGGLYVTNVDAAECSFSLKTQENAAALDLTLLDGSGAPLLEARVTRSRGIRAEWVTGMVDLGTSDYSKRLRGMTVVLEPFSGGMVSFGYEARHGGRMQAYHASPAFSFRDLSFVNFTFDAGFARSYHASIFERGVNYVSLRLLSDNALPCAIHAVSVEYEITKKNKGVR